MTSDRGFVMSLLKSPNYKRQGSQQEFFIVCWSRQEKQTVGAVVAYTAIFSAIPRSTVLYRVLYCATLVLITVSQTTYYGVPTALGFLNFLLSPSYIVAQRSCLQCILSSHCTIDVSYVSKILHYHVCCMIKLASSFWPLHNMGGYYL